MIYKQRKIFPYYFDRYGQRKTACNIRNVAGTYLIYDLDDNLIYVGYSKNNLYRTLYRHFQQWNDSQYRAVYDPAAVKVRVVYTNSGTQAHSLEIALIIKFRPRDNENKYLEYTTERKEDLILETFLNSDTQPVAEFKEDLPF
jgi:excinuclease UvrABC nuclease subunit